MKKLKWLIKELVKVYSNEESYFSKRRLESGTSFFVGQLGMLFFLFNKYQGLSMGELILWASLEFTIAGYIMNKIYDKNV